MPPSDTEHASAYPQLSYRESGTQIYDPRDSAGVCTGAVSACSAGGIDCPLGLPLETAGDWVGRGRGGFGGQSLGQARHAFSLAGQGSGRPSLPWFHALSVSIPCPCPLHSFACSLGLTSTCLSSSTWFPLMPISRCWPLHPHLVHVGQWVMGVVSTGNRGKGGDGGAPGLQPAAAA